MVSVELSCHPRFIQRGAVVLARAASQELKLTGKKVSMISLGCPKNTVDGEVMLGDLNKADAQSESLEAIIEAKQLMAEKENKRLIVTGCMAQRYADSLASELPEVDAVVGFERYSQLPSKIAEVLDPNYVYTDSNRVHVGTSSPPFRSETDRIRLTPPHTAYIRVAEGCDHACSFCAIPGFRGKFRSKRWDSIMEEARKLVASGVKEINLIAEDTNQYGMDRKDGPRLQQLLRQLSLLEGLHWIRILYAYPSYFSDELIDEIATNEKVCKYIDMPLQHISNLTLLAMNRPPRKHTENLLNKLRARIPNLVMRTSFICGFPGESVAQHEELVQFCQSFKFERMGAFAYSTEEGTTAAEFPEQVEQEERLRRRDALVSLQQKVGQQWAKKMVGKTIPVLIDSRDEDGGFVGRTQYDAPDIDHIVMLTDSDDATVPRIEAGQLRQVEITQNITFDLVGHPVS